MRGQSESAARMSVQCFDGPADAGQMMRMGHHAGRICLPCIKRMSVPACSLRPTNTDRRLCGSVATQQEESKHPGPHVAGCNGRARRQLKRRWWVTGAYYHRPAAAGHEGLWVIQLMGGGWCTTGADCGARAITHPVVMSSSALQVRQAFRSQSPLQGGLPVKP